MEWKDLPNTRPIKGTKKLLRSGELHKAGPEDQEALLHEEDLGLVIDLRTELERLAAPDPHLPAVRNVHIPLLKTMAYEKLGLDLFVEKGDAMMEQLYRDVVVSEEGMAGLKRVFALLLEGDGRTVLWHCTQGKDRTGIVAALLACALGMDEEAILEDYLLINRYLKREGGPSLDFLFEAKPAFLKAAKEAILERWPDMDAYLLELGIGPEEKKRLRTLYLNSQ